MTKTTPYILWLLAAALILSCENSKPETPVAPQEPEYQAIEPDSITNPVILREAPPDSLTVEKILIYCDSVTMRVNIDTVVRENCVSYHFANRWIDLYNFNTQEEASDFFNDLKARDLIRAFGIDKNPQHIHVNGKQVLWYHFTHGNGHKMDQVIQQFRNQVGFFPMQDNRDSVSGFNYCSCKGDDADLHHLLGNWHSVQTSPQAIDSLLPSYARRETGPDSLVLAIVGDSIYLNGVGDSIKGKKSIHLPDCYHFYNYFDDRIVDDYEALHPTYAWMRKQRMDTRNPVTYYNLYAGRPHHHYGITFVKVEGSSLLAYYKGKVYVLGRG